eukprot:363883-Chlamydomonas_euryale.AAC.4
MRASTRAPGPAIRVVGGVQAPTRGTACPHELMIKCGASPSMGQAAGAGWAHLRPKQVPGPRPESQARILGRRQRCQRHFPLAPHTSLWRPTPASSASHQPLAPHTSLWRPTPASSAPHQPLAPHTSLWRPTPASGASHQPLAPHTSHSARYPAISPGVPQCKHSQASAPPPPSALASPPPKHPRRPSLTSPYRLSSTHPPALPDLTVPPVKRHRCPSLTSPYRLPNTPAAPP